MDTIKITENMVNGIGRPKDARYLTNMYPTIPIAVFEIYGETMQLKMDRFREPDEDSGIFNFEVSAGNTIMAKGEAQFALKALSPISVTIASITAHAESQAVECFVRKCIMCLNEFNYTEWKSEVYAKSKRKNKTCGKSKTGRTYRIIIPKSAESNTEPLSNVQLFEMLRHENKTILAKNVKKSRHYDDNSSDSNNDAEPKNGDTIIKDVRPYVRRTAAWYVRGHYDHHGHYHQFYFAQSKIAVNSDYADFRAPIK